MTNHRMFFVKSGLALTLAFSTLALETRAQAPNAENPAPQNTAKSWLDLGRTHARAGEWDQAHQAYNRVLGMDNLNARTEFDALAGIARAWRAEKKLPQMESALEEVLAGDFYHPVLMTSLLKEFATLAQELNDLPRAVRAWEQIMAAEKCPAKFYREGTFALLELFARQNRLEEIRQRAEKASADAALAAPDRFLAGLIAHGAATTPSDPEELAAEAQRLMAAVLPAEEAPLTREQQVESIHQAGKFFMRLRDYEQARVLLELAESLHQEPLRNRIQCLVVDRAPRTPDEWLASPVLNHPTQSSSRFIPYNQAAARLLAYDVGQTDRTEVSYEFPSGEAKTTLAMAADVQGWHLFVKCNDPASALVAAGLLNGGKLEMFFRPGDRGAYYQWFVDFPRSEKVNAILWDSPHRHFRPMEDYAVIDTKTLADGFAACITIPWTMLYDKLPRNGDLWPFSLQRWSRLGSVTWGGKVHEINRFGRVEWQGLSPELELAIKRDLVLKAWAHYRSLRSTLANHWQDEMIGDPAFYRQALKAPLERLDAFGERVSADMSAETVHEIFDAAVADWMEIEYGVADLRKEWLLKALLGVETASSQDAGE